ncbi:MAG: 1,4-alpha-glucan-branching enzyme, partial [Chlamydiae bacterium]
IMEHPYYGSFGYHVSNFFAASSRFGTPDELKELVDAAHEAGLAVIMDIVHSHAVKNEIEGLSKFDGTYYQYFHKGQRGLHDAWDSRCFDYGKPEVLHFLLSNCKFWLDEYKLDGFRFDGVTSMLYHHHGLGPAFDSYEKYFDGSVDDDAIAYLSLANKLIHSVKPTAITIAEDVSGMPGLAAPQKEHGIGFDYRLAMGVPDHWFNLMTKLSDEDWDMSTTWHELTNRRADEKVISYVECHDQAIVGGKTVIFQLIDADMYSSMKVDTESLKVDRGIALHKIIRLATLASAGHGYLNFIGNEFGHPEWVDFPREGNNWSHHYARRQWSLRDNKELKYHFLADFDREIISLVRKEEIIEKRQPRLLRIDNNDKIICFERSGFIFIFNFHPSHSVVDYGIEVFPGKYSLVLNSDEKKFGGFERVKVGQQYQTTPVIENKTCRNMLKFYLPCRTGMVLKAIAL